MKKYFAVLLLGNYNHSLGRPRDFGRVDIQNSMYIQSR